MGSAIFTFSPGRTNRGYVESKPYFFQKLPRFHCLDQFASVKKHSPGFILAGFVTSSLNNVRMWSSSYECPRATARQKAPFRSKRLPCHFGAGTETHNHSKEASSLRTRRPDGCGFFHQKREVKTDCRFQNWQRSHHRDIGARRFFWGGFLSRPTLANGIRDRDDRLRCAAHR